ncbi:MAG TPA: uroporphyrinogen decarboxylase family protein [bacterium]|nr:uroporphyrinogen decarboxylase family protein [bacterium]
MDAKERVQRLLRGEPVDRIPFALWRHLPPEDTTPEGLAEATVRFVRRWDFDLVKAMFLNRTWTEHWGTEFEPYDRGGGFYPVRRCVIRQPGDWGQLKPFDPTRGLFGEQLAMLRMMRQALGDRVPIAATIFSPLTVGIELAGPAVHEHTVTSAPQVHRAMKLISAALADFAQACVEAGADGLFLAVQSAREGALSPDAFEAFGLAYDLPILERVRARTWINILHLCKSGIRLETARQYPVQAVNWHDRGPGNPALRDALGLFSGVLIAGLDHEGTGQFVRGVPEEAAAQARDAIAQTGGKRLMLGPGCVTHLGTPEANIDAVRQVAHAHHA